MNRSYMILLVEDDIDVRATVAELLQEEGYHVVTARNGHEALKYLQSGERRPDMILLDLLMPVMDGWEFRNRQKADPELAAIPVVVYSAQVDRQPIDATLIVRKPVRLDELLRAISTVARG